MNPATAAAVAALIQATFEIVRTHMNKPPEWKPTMEDFNDLIALVDLATPENEKAAAALRLGLNPTP